MHQQNSFRDLQALAVSDTDQVLGRFFAWEQANPVVRLGFPSHVRDGATFARFVKSHGYRRYVDAARGGAAAVSPRS